jgi:prepilin-type N-terminal cleavage/methylation domain-containing protein
MAPCLPLKRLPRSKPGVAGPAGCDGFTLVELLITLAIAGVVLVALSGVTHNVMMLWNSDRARTELLYQGNLAMDRMVTAVSHADRLLVPRADNPATPQDEAQRPLLAVTIDPLLDSDGDGFADADNDHDGRVDEDIPADNTFDYRPGIQNIDDDGDGSVDEGSALQDNDEDGQAGDDWLDDVDNDGDGATDEDIPADNDTLPIGASEVDNDGDGLFNDDWLDPVVFLVSSDGKSLIQRTPVVNWPDGSGTTDTILARADAIVLSIRRVPTGVGVRSAQVEITLQLATGATGPLTIQARVRLNRDG